MTTHRADLSAAALVEEVIESHGGLERWREISAVDLRLSSGGSAFAAKGQPQALLGVTATVTTAGQTVAVSGRRPRPWDVRFDDGDRSGKRLATLRRGRRRLVWSATDVGAFAAAALWTYVQVPFVLARPGVEVEPLGRYREAGETWLRLGVSFPDTVATHCRRQVLYVDDTFRIVRHDYTALAFGRWARAAQYLSAYRDHEGLSFATRRRVFPRLPGGARAPWPKLVWIDVHEVALR